MNTLARAAIASVLVLCCTGCIQDEGDTTGPNSGPGGGNGTGNGTGNGNACGADPESRPPTSGTYSGSFQIGDDGGDDFPLRLELDVGNGRVGGDVEFSDSERSYAGPVSATINADGAIEGAFSGSAPDRRVDGSFSGVMDALRGCGTWTNTAGQSGVWNVSR